MWSSQAVVAALDDLDYHLSTVVRSLFVFYKFKVYSLIASKEMENKIVALKEKSSFLVMHQNKYPRLLIVCLRKENRNAGNKNGMIIFAVVVQKPSIFRFALFLFSFLI